MLILYTTVFRYLAEKYLQRLKQQTAEDPQVVHTSSNKIGKYAAVNQAKCYSLLKKKLIVVYLLWISTLTEPEC